MRAFCNAVVDTRENLEGEATEAVHGLSGLAFKILSRVYNGVAERAHLQNKGDFREKLGTMRDPTYICYPKGGMSMSAVRELMHFFRE